MFIKDEEQQSLLTFSGNCKDSIWCMRKVVKLQVAGNQFYEGRNLERHLVTDKF